MRRTTPLLEQRRQHQVELLAPAGDSEAMHAAVANGADAVYFGLANFNARHRAANVEAASLDQTIEYLHGRNVRGYVAFNTLVFSDELEQAATCLAEIADSGADAIIVQDLGILRLVQEMVPALPCHGSTQMTLSDARGIEMATAMGLARVILARELSLENIRAITAQTSTPVEVFCHGALCVAYSGQCLTSESIGGRSANRGMCAQACRLPYELMVDGRHFDQHGKQFLLSPQDLAAYDRVGQLADAGVASLKIEGRLKSAQYVAATTSAYRLVVDAAMADRDVVLPARMQDQLKQSFSRGFSHGFLDGVDHRALVIGSFSKKRGVNVGTVRRVTASSIVLELQPRQMIKPGDGIVFDEGHPEQDEQGGRVYEAIALAPQTVELRFGRGAVATSAVSAGALVWKTDDPAINRELEQTYNRDVVVRRQPLACDVRAVAGEKLRLTLTDPGGRSGAAQSESPVELARKFPLDESMLRQQVGRLGDTPYELGTVSLHGRHAGDPPHAVMAPKSVLNELRRAAVQDLMEKARAAGRHDIVQRDALMRLRTRIASEFPPCARGQERLAVLVRSMEQLELALSYADRIGRVWCEFEDPRRYRDAMNLAGGRPLGLTTMRILKPGEDGFLKVIADCQPAAVLLRNLSAWSYLASALPEAELVGDYSLNVANEISAFVLLKGIAAARPLTRLTPSHDLNAAQLEAMLRRVSGSRFEVVLHQHMPMFHMEHCVFAHMLSNGKDYRDCGRPCEKHKVALRDRVGIEHPLQADAGCRNTVFNGRAQSAQAYVLLLRNLGVSWFRVELLQENSAQAGELLDHYLEVIAGQTSAPRAKTPLKVLNLMGVTPGTMQWE